MTNQPTPRLVPDWVVEADPGRRWTIPTGGEIRLLPKGKRYPVGLFVDISSAWMGAQEAKQLAKALNFFAEHDRLPTKTDDHPLTKAYEALGVPKEAQGDE